MALNAVLGTGLTIVTNADPNTLTTVAPYAYSGSNKLYTAPSAAWTSQNRPALFPNAVWNGEGDKRIYLDFIPSAGSGVTYTVTAWFFNPSSGAWVKPYNSPTMDYTGNVRDYIDKPGVDAIFLQIVSISSGTLSIYFSPENARKG